MCVSCWEELGRPLAEGSAIDRAVSAVRELYAHTAVGGALHIVTDDWNLSDGDVAFCEGYIGRSGDAEQTVVERECWEALTALTEFERGAALAQMRGYAARLVEMTR